MRNRDLHQSLKNEILEKRNTGFGEVAFVKQAWGKDDVQLTVHASPNTYSSYGLQWPDFLSYLGFKRNTCQFVTSTQCFSRIVDDGFNLNQFCEMAEHSFRDISNAQSKLQSCGFIFDQPEGWGYFFGKRSQNSRYSSHYSGDGHTSGIEQKVLKESEDENFKYLFTWIKNSDAQKGWTIHYRPKHFPLSIELESVFHFLGIQQFGSCPQFDFDFCWWKHIPFKGQGAFDGNADVAHRFFDAHTNNFSDGIKALLEAQSKMESVSMGFLNFSHPKERRNVEIVKRISSEKILSKKPSNDSDHFDVAISFAGTERKYAQEVAEKLQQAGYKVFYDDFYQDQLWGKNLVEFFYDIYSKRARYCLIFLSKQYLEREWTIHERRSAQERMLKEKGSEYILPVKIDDSELPGMPTTIGYVGIDVGIEKISQLLINKLGTN